MTFAVRDLIGATPIANVDSVQRHQLGQIVNAVDPTFGEGEFIYLKGVASTVIGSLVTYNATDFTTTLSAATANLARPVAVAMSANAAATTFGWYQVSGLATVKKTAVKCDPTINGNRIYQSGTAGRVMQTSVAGECILGAARANLTTVTSTTSAVVLSINRPHYQGPIT